MNMHSTNKAFDKFYDKLKRIVANDKTFTFDDHFWYGFDLQSDMSILCEYSGIQYNASNNFVKYWNNHCGNCHTFNKEKDLNQV